MTDDLYNILIMLFIGFSIENKLSCKYEKEMLKINFDMNNEVKNLISNLKDNLTILKGFPFYVDLGKAVKTINPISIRIDKGKDLEIFLELNEEDKTLFKTIKGKKPISILTELNKVIDKELYDAIKNTKRLTFSNEKTDILVSLDVDFLKNSSLGSDNKKKIFEQPFLRSYPSSRVFFKGEPLTYIQNIDNKIPLVFMFDKNEETIILVYREIKKSMAKNIRDNSSNTYLWILLIIVGIIGFSFILYKYPSIGMFFGSIFSLMD
jgi:hypothetical protein